MVQSNNGQQQTIGTCFTSTNIKSWIFPLSVSTWKLIKRLHLILIVVLICVTGAGRDVGMLWSQSKQIYHQRLISFYMLSVVTVRQPWKRHVAWCYVLAERMNWSACQLVEIAVVWIAKTSKRKELVSWTTVQSHWVGPRLTQPFIFPKSIKWAPGTPRDLVVLSPHSGSAALRQLNHIYETRAIKFWNLSF